MICLPHHQVDIWHNSVDNYGKGHQNLHLFYMFYFMYFRRMWDKFQMMPREQQSQSETFRPLFRIFKLICYLILFCLVLGSAVINKICILMMTSTITKV